MPRRMKLDVIDAIASRVKRLQLRFVTIGRLRPLLHFRLAQTRALTMQFLRMPVGIEDGNSGLQRRVGA